MALKLVTSSFKLHSALQFVESLTEPKSNKYFIYEAQHRAFPDDNNPPQIIDSPFENSYSVWDNLIHGKLVSSGDVAHMIKRVDWVSGRIYDRYAHDDIALDTKEFYVQSAESGDQHIFKCLDNNLGVPSVNAPLLSQTSKTAESYFTADGYQWKYMYTITGAQTEQFTTTGFMPVFKDVTVEGAAVPGAIDNIRLDNEGKNYRSHATAEFKVISVSNDDLIYEITDVTGSLDTLSINNDFYNNNAIFVTTAGTNQLRTITDYFVTGLGIKRVTVDSAFDPLPAVGDTLFITPLVTIVGDGTGAKARAVVDIATDKVASIEVINRGKDYTFATATVVGNTGLIADPIADTATATVLLGPIDGHGSDNFQELLSTRVCISTTISGTEGGNISATNDFREFGLIKDPLMRGVKLDVTHSGVSRVAAGEFVFGQTSNSHGKISNVPNSNSVQTITVDRVFGIFQPSENLYVASTLAAAEALAVADTGGTTEIAIIDAAGVTHNVVNNGVFDQRQVYNVSLDSGDNLIQDEKIFQDQGLATEATAFVHELALPLLFLTGQKGAIISSDAGTGTNRFIFGEDDGNRSKFKIISQNRPEMHFGSGQVVYKEHISPVTRTAGQKETIKLVLEF